MTSPSAARAGTTSTAPLKRKIAAIMAADVAGYSRLVAEAEERTLNDLAAAREVFDAVIARAGGRIFNTAGDSVMCEFDSAVEAVRAAIDIQDELRTRNLGVDPGRRLEFRIGLTIGDVVERGGDLLGDGVNIAARLEGMAPPGGICVSRSVHEAVANKLPVTFRELAPRQVKNIPQPIHAYLVNPPGPSLTAPEPLIARNAASTRAARPAGIRVARRLAFIGVVAAGVVVSVPAVKLLRQTVESYAPAAPRPADTPEIAAPTLTEAPTTSPSPTPPARQARPAEKPPGPQRQAQPASRPDPTKPDAPKANPERNPPADPAAAYALLAREGMLPEARTLPELYHNARILESKGDRNAALAAYAAAAPLAGEAVDVHLRHASLLRATKGSGSARQTFAALAKSAPSGAVALVSALSAEGDDRRARIEAFSSAHPDLAVADYLLADALTENRDGGPTVTERRLAFDALDRFLDAAGTGALAGRFVDQAFLDGWLDGARRRRGEIETFFASAATRPAATFTRTTSGWIARVTVPEPATAVTVRAGERGEPLPTGPARSADPRPGRPASNLEIEIPSSTGRTTLYVSYTDRAGRLAGPFPIAFDPASATADSGRAALERYPDSWVSFRPDIPDLLSYAGLVSNRCAIARATIGFGDGPPRDALPLPACDATGPTAMPSGTSLMKLPDGTDAVQVQLTYADGSESQVRTFRRP